MHKSNIRIFEKHGSKHYRSWSYLYRFLAQGKWLLSNILFFCKTCLRWHIELLINWTPDKFETYYTLYNLASQEMWYHLCMHGSWHARTYGCWYDGRTIGKSMCLMLNHWPAKWHLLLWCLQYGSKLKDGLTLHTWTEYLHNIRHLSKTTCAAPFKSTDSLPEVNLTGDHVMQVSSSW